MPFYDLICSDCASEANILASVSDKTDRKIPCPKCGSFKMETNYNFAPAFVKNMGDAAASCGNAAACGVGHGGCRFGK